MRDESACFGRRQVADNPEKPSALDIHSKHIGILLVGGEAVAVGALLLYTALLVFLGFLSRRATRGRDDEFLDGGRRFGFWQVFTLVTAMWASWMLPVELETAFLSGLSAIWFGVSVIAMSLVAAIFLLAPFRRLGYLTNSHLIGQRYGRTARTISAVIIGGTFPIFAMGNVVAAAALLHVLLGWPLWIALAGASAVILLYVSANGLWSLAYTQVANLLMLTIGLVVAAIYVLRGHSVFRAAILPTPGFLHWSGIGLTMILVWFAMNLLNTVTAQAEFQAMSAVRDSAVGRRAVYLSSIVLIGFALVPVLLGMAAREQFPHAANGLPAFAMLLQHVAPPWAVLVVMVGFWASALTWCSPLLFSGASSFGLDLWNRSDLPFTARAVRRWIQWSVLLQGILLVVYALARPDDLGWWQVFGLTIRNAVVVAPTIVFLMWSVVRPRTVVAAMLAGLVGGLAWNAASGFSPTVFTLGINPMWVGTGTSLLVIITGTMVFPGVRLRLVPGRWRLSLGVALAASGTLALALSALVPSLIAAGLRGPGLFLGVIAWFFGLVAAVEERTATPSQQVESPASVQADFI